MKFASCLTAAAFGLGLLSASAAFAQDGARPCKADEAKLCAGIQPGGGRIAACMKQHKDDLSPACKQQLAKRHERRQGRRGGAASGAASGADDE
jgi:hypothetical protein